MASGFWLFYASSFSCFDIISDVTFDPVEVMLTLFFFFSTGNILFAISLQNHMLQLHVLFSEKGILE